MEKRTTSLLKKSFPVRKKTGPSLCRWGTPGRGSGQKGQGAKPQEVATLERLPFRLGFSRRSYNMAANRVQDRARPWDPSAPRIQPRTRSRTCRK